MSTNRMKAAEQGLAVYDGKPCKNCGETQKHTINATCVTCSRTRSVEAMSKQRQKIKDLLTKAKGAA